MKPTVKLLVVSSVVAVFSAITPWLNLIHAQTPTLGFFTRNPWPAPFNYPCHTNTGNDPEFHPLRPYPGNPCDVLIPAKVPEAPDDPNKVYLSFHCAKSLNVSGYDEVSDVIDMCGLSVLPANPISVPLTQEGGDRSDDYLCESGSTDICYVKRVRWTVAINATNSQLPIFGQTEVAIPDDYKVNQYLNWYLNGTVFQSEKLPLNGFDPADTKRITSYSGPINKLYPKDFRDDIKETVASNNVGSQYHNYLVSCQRNIDFDYVLDALEAIFTNSFGSFLDVVRMIDIIRRVGMNNMQDFGGALVNIALLPGDQFNPIGIRNVLLNYGFTVIANNLDDVNMLFSLGRNLLSRIGNITAALRLDLAEPCVSSTLRRRLSWVASNFDTETWTHKYINYSTLEDTVSEFTASVIPEAQPVDIDGRILTIGLSFPTLISGRFDSRLYFPHMKSAVPLSSLVQALHQPYPVIVPPTAPPPPPPIPTPVLSTNPADYLRAFYLPAYNLIDVYYGLPGMGEALWNQFHVFDPTTNQDYGPLSNYVDPSVSVQRYYEGIIPTWPHSYYRYGGSSQWFVSRGLPGSIRIRLAGSSYSSQTVVLATPTPTPTPPAATHAPLFSSENSNMFSQRVARHQGFGASEGHSDETVVLCQRYFAGSILRGCSGGGTVIRNTEIIDGPAPAALYVPSDFTCDEAETRTSSGDRLLGNVLNGNLTYRQLFRYTPRLVIGCDANPCPAGAGNCINRPCSLEGDECNDQLPGGECCTIQIGQRCPWISECYHASSTYDCRAPGPNGCGENREIIDLDCGNAGEICCAPTDEYACRSRSGYDSYASVCSALDQTGCTAAGMSPYCEWRVVRAAPALAPRPPHCPVWPTRNLRSAARVNPFVKTPYIEKLYDILVAGPNSVLRRWMPKLPLTGTYEACTTTSPRDLGICSNQLTETACQAMASQGYSCIWQITQTDYDITNNRDVSIPAGTSAAYNGQVQNLINPRVTAGRNVASGGIGGGLRTSGGAFYFPKVGSLADHILGVPTRENLNLQRALRPKGFVGSVSPIDSPGGINCNTNLPETNTPCVDRTNYIDIARRWTNFPDGTFAELCYNDVVTRADAAGVNPGLSLLIWLNESDASNYEANTPVEDFGVHVGQYNTPNNFDQQITGHLLTVNAIRSRCASEINTYGGVRVFSAIYLVGDSCIPTAESDLYALGDGTAANPGLQGKWEWIAPSCPFPFP